MGNLDLVDRVPDFLLAISIACCGTAACDPEREHWREYVAATSNECTSLDIDCPPQEACGSPRLRLRLRLRTV